MLTHKTFGPVAVVPTEATEEMIDEAARQVRIRDAMWKRRLSPSDMKAQLATAHHFGMLAAAPPEPTADVEAVIVALRNLRERVCEDDEHGDGAHDDACPICHAVVAADAALAPWETNDG